MKTQKNLSHYATLGFAAMAGLLVSCSSVEDDNSPTVYPIDVELDPLSSTEGDRLTAIVMDATTGDTVYIASDTVEDGKRITLYPTSANFNVLLLTGPADDYDYFFYLAGLSGNDSLIVADKWLLYSTLDPEEIKPSSSSGSGSSSSNKGSSSSKTSSSSSAIALGKGEGSETKPVELTLESSHRGQVGVNPDDTSYYTITLGPGVYEFRMDSLTGDADLEVDDDSFYSTSVECVSDAWDQTPELCKFTNSSDSLTYYIRVVSAADSLTLRYNLLVTKTGDILTSEGTSSKPILLTYEKPRRGSVGPYYPTDASYYRIYLPAGNYTVHLDSVTDDAYLYLFSNGFDYSSTCYDPTAKQSVSDSLMSADCSFAVTNPLDTLYFRVSENNTTAGAYYSIVVDTNTSPVPVDAHEGSAASPMKISAETVHSGYVGESSANYYSYYQVKVTPGTYQVNIRDVIMDGTSSSAYIYAYVYTDAAFSSSDCYTSVYTTSDDYCTVALTTTDSVLYIKIDNDYYGGSYGYNALYELEVNRISDATVIDYGEGTQYAPVSLPLDSIHTGFVNSTDQYSYYAWPVVIGNSYTVSVTPSTSADLELYVGSTLGTAQSGNYCSVTALTYSTQSCTFTATNDTVYIEVDNDDSGVVQYSVLATAE